MKALRITAISLLIQSLTAMHAWAETLEIQTNHERLAFTVELAKTEDEQARGLMFRHSLPENTGMLFVWDEETNQRMWMKNTLIPLDMLFIDSGGRIVYIAHNATPESTAVIESNRPVRGVLEIAGGTAKKKHIEIGNRVIHPAFAP